LRDKFQQCRILKIIAAYQSDALTSEVRMRVEVNFEPLYISCIHEIHGTAKRRILNALVERKAQIIRGRRLLDSPLQFRPAREAAFAGNCQLCVSQFELSGE